jgi:hypothetical protein
VAPPATAPSAIAASCPTEWMPLAAGSWSGSTTSGISALPATVEIIPTRPHKPTHAKTNGREPAMTPTSAPAIVAAQASSLQTSTRCRGSRSTIDAATPPPTIGGTRRMIIRSATAATDDVDS